MTGTLLENNRDLFSAAEFKELKWRYTRHHWDATNEGQEERAKKDEVIRQSRILSQLYVDRKPQMERLRELLFQIESLQTRIFAIGRARNAHGLYEDPDIITDTPAPEPPAPPKPKAPSNQPQSAWFTAYPELRRSDSAATIKPARAGPSTAPPEPDEAAEHGFEVKITRFRKPRAEAGGDGGGTTAGTGQKIYRRVVSVQNSEKRVDIYDPELFVVGGGENRISTTSLQEIVEIGKRLLRQPGVPEGSVMLPAPPPREIISTTTQRYLMMPAETPELTD